MPEKLKISRDFKLKTTSAILSVILFVVVYFILIGLALGLTVICGLLGYFIITLKITFITFILGLGIISMAVIVLLFLFKFITKKHKTNNSHLLEIYAEDEPELFSMIADVVTKTKTHFPKHIYLSCDVNAAVFYDSTFWSMFLPIKKNLVIGVGLMNTSSVSELKSIIAHEFGHFSQRSMKVGSFVYNVNQVIFNLVNEDDRYDQLVKSFAEVSKYLGFFAGLSMKINQGIKWTLRKVYYVVNINYLALSREMEFHADGVAAHLTGSSPLIDSLLRSELAAQSFNLAIDFYNDKIKAQLKPENLYDAQRHILISLAKKNALPLNDELPLVTQEYFIKAISSKLIIKDQWSSHPTVADRIDRLKKLEIDPVVYIKDRATSLLKDNRKTEAYFTDYVFENVDYKNPHVIYSALEFALAYDKMNEESSLPTIFNGYYDSRNVYIQNPAKKVEAIILNNNTHGGELFSDYYVSLINEHQALVRDIELIRQIVSKELVVKYFDYNGLKYRAKESETLLQKLQQQLSEIFLELENHDKEIAAWFVQAASIKGIYNEYVSEYENFSAFDLKYDDLILPWIKLNELSAFINQNTTFATIEENLLEVYEQEKLFKSGVRDILYDNIFQDKITMDIRKNLSDYINADLVYFNYPEYDNEALSIFITAKSNFYYVLSATYFHQKKRLLMKQAELLDDELTESRKTFNSVI